VETPEYLEGRLEEATRYLPLEQLALCPRCGFGSASNEQQQWGKLRVIQQVSDAVWK
jgi:5-methyltetrahydropteroyltriglutamate--homocysteine methyltransferase